MKIALASSPHPKSINEGLYWVEKLTKEAATKQAAIVCFPESYIPGYPDGEREEPSPEKMQAALKRVCEIAAENAIAIIIPMDWYEGDAVLNIAHVIADNGGVLGYQTKNQLAPSEDNIWIPGTKRHIFEVKGVKFGITICHEGFRYPESVRWAARNDAKIVFHAQFTGRDTEGELLTEWGGKNNPYHEKAMVMRALENTIYFASVNYATRFQESATSIIAPDGSCMAHQPYGETGVIVAEIDPDKATGLFAKRFKPEWYYNQ